MSLVVAQAALGPKLTKAESSDFQLQVVRRLRTDMRIVSQARVKNPNTKWLQVLFDDKSTERDDKQTEKADSDEEGDDASQHSGCSMGDKETDEGETPDDGKETDEG